MTQVYIMIMSALYGQGAFCRSAPWAEVYDNYECPEE